MCKIKGKKTKRNFLSFSSLVPYNFVHITKTVGILQNFGINDNKTTITAQGWRGGQRNGSGKSDSVTPPFIKIPLNQSEINHNELYNLHIEHKKINKS